SAAQYQIPECPAKCAGPVEICGEVGPEKNRGVFAKSRTAQQVGKLDAGRVLRQQVHVFERAAKQQYCHAAPENRAPSENRVEAQRNEGGDGEGYDPGETAHRGPERIAIEAVEQ